jgi:protein TonB
MGQKGIVELDATIGVDGKVKGVKVVKGPSMLQKAAQDAVMQWQYKPTLLNGTPVENQTHIIIEFKPNK